MFQVAADHDVEGNVVRVADHDVRFGVSVDEGDGDEWPALREKVLAADILIVATPIWMGQPASVCKMVLEHLDAELSEKDEQGRPLVYGKVALVGVVGNEDGAHHVSAEVFQTLNDVGFTIPAAGATYWVGEAMSSVEYNDLVGLQQEHREQRPLPPPPELQPFVTAPGSIGPNSPNRVEPTSGSPARGSILTLRPPLHPTQQSAPPGCRRPASTKTSTRPPV